ncbi:MAG: hypothetical protein AB8B72_14520 [Crocinitomicaceae bacterium]
MKTFSFKHIAPKIAALAIIVTVSNFLYIKYFYQSDLKKHSDLVDILNKIPADTEILYVAESSNTALHKNDTIKKTISEFIDDAIPSKRVSDLTKPAAHAGIYKKLLKALPKKNKIETVIVTVNLRSFNAQWIHSSLETALQKSTIFLKPYPPLISRFLLSFKDYQIKSAVAQELAFKAKWENDVLNIPYDFKHRNVADWDLWMAIEGVKNEDGSKNQALTELACHYIKGYGFQIDTLNNPRISDFNDIIEIAQERNWHLIFNLLAENTEKAEILVGKDLIYLMRQNRNLLVNYFGRKGITVVDNLEIVPDKYFIDQDWTTEHYSDFGRKKVALNVANEIAKLK